MHAVGAVMQGAEQGQQVLHVLAPIQPFDIDRLEAQLRRTAADFGDQCVEMRAGANQHGDAFVRRIGTGLADDVEGATGLFANGILSLLFLVSA